MITTWMPVEALAREAPWETAREMALPGLCRGALLRDWAAHVARRNGAEFVARIRAATGIDKFRLPDAPEIEQWYPVGYQIALTRTIVDLALGGDLLALEPLLAEDAARHRDRVLEAAVRLLGPKRAIRRSGKVHAWLYDTGRVEADVGDGHARLSFEGAAYFGNPTWRVLQTFATRGLLRGFGKQVVTLEGDVGRTDGFGVRVAWR